MSQGIFSSLPSIRSVGLPIVQKFCEPTLLLLLRQPEFMYASSYKFRQASDFWYLTGFQEADAALILG